MTQTVIGYFDTPDAAQAAEEKLARRGIDESALHLAAEDTAYTGSTVPQRPARHGTSGIRQFFAELFGTDNDEDAGHYSEAVRRGGVVLAVDVPEGTPIEEVREALEEAGAVDIDERVEQWRQQGYSGYNPEAQPYSADEVARERKTVLPVIEESIEVGKREVARGTVRVYTRTVEEPFSESVTLREERATIERRPVDRPASANEIEALGEKSVEVREMAEKAVVNKTARVVEEVEVGKEVTERTETIDDTLRHTEVEIDRGDDDARSGAAVRSDNDNTAGRMRRATAAKIDPMDLPAGAMAGGLTPGMAGTKAGVLSGETLRSYDDYESDFRNDFSTRYAADGGDYADYEPAYRFGHGLASDSRYRGRDWSSIESDVQREWGARYPDSAWERFKAAVEHGWERVTGQR